MQHCQTLNFPFAHAIVGMLVLLSLPLGAQESRASIQGRVNDASGAVVPHAAVVVKNVGTNVSLKTTTNDEGNYQISLLNPGKYMVSATSAGFKTANSVDIELRVGDRI